MSVMQKVSCGRLRNFVFLVTLNVKHNKGVELEEATALCNNLW